MPGSPATPTGQGDYTAQPGDSVASIAHEHGFFWQTLWDHPGNSDLKQARATPHVLLPGDRVTVPPLTIRQEDAPTEQHHRFKRKGVPGLLKIRIMKPFEPEDPEPADQPDFTQLHVSTEDPEEKEQGMEPAKDTRYRLVIDGVPQDGSTDGQGYLSVSIDPAAREGLLIVSPGTEQEWRLTLLLGGLDPVESRTGQAQRLFNLGYYRGPVDQPNDSLDPAIDAFRAEKGLSETGEPAEETLDKLKEVHGS
jgi:N-acetylmuramoyl-L-alanine amidase